MLPKKYKRIILKLSGQIVAGENKFGFSNAALQYLKEEIVDALNLGVEIGIVMGGGNVFRGQEAVEQLNTDRVSADYLGMLATLFNASLLQNVLDRSNVPAHIMTALSFSELAEPFMQRRAIHHLEKKRIVIFACGTGNPYFTTDTAAVLRAIEMKSDVILKGTRVRGIYDKDPEEFKDAHFFETLHYSYVIQHQLKVMDSTAFSLAMDNNLPILVFNILKKGYLRRILEGENIGTIVSDNN